MQRGVAAKQKSPNGDEERADSPSLFVIQLILERWSNPGIPSKNELGNCNTVKKSLNWLSDHNFEYEFFDVKKNVLSKHLINDWIKNISSPYTSENLINKTGMTWRKLSEEEKKLPLTMDNIINLIKKYPTAMKRPLITLEGKVLAIGFDENIYEEKIK